MAYSRTGAAWANPYAGKLRGCQPRGLLQHPDRQEHGSGAWLQHQHLHGQHRRFSRWSNLQPEHGNSGQGTANRGGFIYNTNTNAAIAAGKNIVYAGKDGTVYRYNKDNGNWSINSGNGWQPVDKPQPKLQTQQEMRSKGAQRTQNFNSMRSYRGAQAQLPQLPPTREF